MTAPEPTPYTPTDAQVRYAWAYQASPGVRVTRVMSDERDAEFDRWLARVRAEARREVHEQIAAVLPGFTGVETLARTIVAELGRARAAETPAVAAPAMVFIDEREKSCTDAWPDARACEYDPRCCRFPKSCSVDGRFGMYPADQVDALCGVPVDGGTCALRPEHGGLHKPAETPDGGA